MRSLHVEVVIRHYVSQLLVCGASVHNRLVMYVNAVITPLTRFDSPVVKGDDLNERTETSVLHDGGNTAMNRTIAGMGLIALIS